MWYLSGSGPAKRKMLSLLSHRISTQLIQVAEMSNIVQIYRQRRTWWRCQAIRHKSSFGDLRAGAVKQEGFLRETPLAETFSVGSCIKKKRLVESMNPKPVLGYKLDSQPKQIYHLQVMWRGEVDPSR